VKQRKRSDQTKVSDPNSEPWVWRSISFAVGEKVYRAITARLQDETFILAKPLEIPPKTVLAVHKSRVTAYSKTGKLNPKLGGPTGENYTLRFSKEVVVDNAPESKSRRSLSRLISARLRAVRCKLVCTSVAEQRKRITSESPRCNAPRD
jgi:hypothetical protein